MRVAVRLNPSPATTTPGASKLGGTFLWPGEEPWPRCAEHDDALAAVLQLRTEDVPEVGFPPGRDLFQLLWCPQAHEGHGYGPRASAFWRTAREITAAQETPEPVLQLSGFAPDECGISPDRVEELPDVWTLGEDVTTAVDTWLRDRRDVLWSSKQVQPELPDDQFPYYNQVRASPVSKVGGHPDWIQEPVEHTCSCGAAMEYLLTIASRETDPSAWQKAGGAEGLMSAIDALPAGRMTPEKLERLLPRVVVDGPHARRHGQRLRPHLPPLRGLAGALGAPDDVSRRSSTISRSLVVLEKPRDFPR